MRIPSAELLMAKSKQRAPEQTFEEVNYLRWLSEHGAPVRIRLSDNSEITGRIEFFDSSFIRLTRDDGPNLFVYKHDIKYLYEAPEE
jgi:sRNA-binding regulator protein Hfq